MLLIACRELDQPLKPIRYWGSTMLELRVQELADLVAIRWEIEPFFEYEKDLLGSDHFQVMTAQAILRFWILTACLICLLEEQRSTAAEPHLTCGDVRRIIQHEHRQNLLRWLQQRLLDGCSVEIMSNQWALSGF